MNHPRVERERRAETASGGDHIRDSGAPSAPRTRRARGSRPLRIGFAFNLKPVNRIALSPNGDAPQRGALQVPSRFHLSAIEGSTPILADEYAEWDDEATVSAIHRALASVGEVVRLEADDDFPHRLRDADPDIVFNVAEGRAGPNRESHVPSFCEFWGYPYTGSDPLTLGICLDKSRTKEILTAHGVPTPDYAVVETGGIIDHQLPLPVVVKPLHEGSSKGITQSSFCETWTDVQREVHRIHDHYDEAALVERYLPGREFTVGILGNGTDARVLPLVEIDFTTLPQDARPIYGYEAKWIWDDPDRPLEIFHCPAECGSRLQSRIEEVSLRAFRVLRCRDWARIDVRLSETGQPNVLEVNPLPGVIPDPAANSCLPKAARVAGMAYDAVIQSVLGAASARYGIPVSA